MYIVDTDQTSTGGHKPPVRRFENIKQLIIFLIQKEDLEDIRVYREIPIPKEHIEEFSRRLEGLSNEVESDVEDELL